MRYREWAPPPALRDQVEAFWALSGEGSSAGESQRIVPDGCAELILNFADPVIQETGGPARQPALMFVGQITGPWQIRPTGRVDLLGVRFRPSGAAGLTPVPQHELVNRSVPLADVAGPIARRMSAVFEAEDGAARLAGLSDVLTASLDRRESVVASSADAIVRYWGMIPIGKLAAGAGLGARQLERRFLDEVGMTPKRLARISRFQRVFQAIERRPIGWTRVAVECGYYDSSHLVRDFHEFAGEAPSRAVRAGEELTLAFTRANRQTG